MKKTLSYGSFLRKWAPVFVLSLALAIIIIDTTLLNVSLSYLIRDLHTDIQSLQWVITAYSLTLAALTITGGRLGDLFGRKKMFIIGAVIFAVGSFIASISTSVKMMIVGESVIEGIGAALMMPATASLLVSLYRGRDRAIAMGMWGGIAAASSAVGPILGGYLTSNYSWRWGFRINIFVVALLVIGSFVLREYTDKKEKHRLDVLGVLLSSLGMLGVVFGIIESSKYGWWHAKKIFEVAGWQLDLHGYSVVSLSMAVGLLLLVLFYFWEKRVKHLGGTPLVSMGLFNNRQFSAGLATTSIMSLGQAGIIFSIPVFLQAVRGLDAFHTGLTFLPMSLAALLTAPLSAGLARRFSPKRLIQAGLVLACIALVLIRHAINIDATEGSFAMGFVIYGIGLGLTMAHISNMTLSAVEVDEAGEASGVNNTIRQIGSSLGSAIIGAALITAITTNLSDGIASSRIIPDASKPQIAKIVAEQASNVEFGGTAQLDGQLPPQIAEEVVGISRQATVDSNRLALIYAIVFTLLGLLTTGFLPAAKNLERSETPAGH